MTACGKHGLILNKFETLYKKPKVIKFCMAQSRPFFDSMIQCGQIFSLDYFHWITPLVFLLYIVIILYNSSQCSLGV